MAETLVEMAKRLCETEGHMGCYDCIMNDTQTPVGAGTSAGCPWG